MSDRADRNPETSYESSDWHVPAIAMVLAMLLLLVVIAVLALYFGFRTAALDVQRSLTVAMPPPTLQTDPQQDLAQLRAREALEYLLLDRPRQEHRPYPDHRGDEAGCHQGDRRLPAGRPMKAAALLAVFAFLAFTAPASAEDQGFADLALEPHPGARLPLATALRD